MYMYMHMYMHMSMYMDMDMHMSMCMSMDMCERHLPQELPAAKHASWPGRHLTAVLPTPSEASCVRHGGFLGGGWWWWLVAGGGGGWWLVGKALRVDGVFFSISSIASIY